MKRGMILAMAAMGLFLSNVAYSQDSKSKLEPKLTKIEQPKEEREKFKLEIENGPVGRFQGIAVGEGNLWIIDTQKGNFWIYLGTSKGGKLFYGGQLRPSIPGTSEWAVAYEDKK